MIDIDAIEQLYTERGDSLDASSYDVGGLCRELRRYRMALMRIHGGLKGKLPVTAAVKEIAGEALGYPDNMPTLDGK